MGTRVSFAEIREVIGMRCASCHAEKPTQPGIAAAPKGVLLETAEQIARQAAEIHKQTVLTRVMPLGNLTAITNEERALVDAWFRSGAKGD